MAIWVGTVKVNEKLLKTHRCVKKLISTESSGVGGRYFCAAL